MTNDDRTEAVSSTDAARALGADPETRLVAVISAPCELATLRRALGSVRCQAGGAVEASLFDSQERFAGYYRIDSRGIRFPSRFRPLEITEQVVARLAELEVEGVRIKIGDMPRD